MFTWLLILLFEIIFVNRMVKMYTLQLRAVNVLGGRLLENRWYQQRFVGQYDARLFIDALCSPAGKRLTSWLSFVMSYCEFVTFPLISWIRCGT